MSFVPEPFHVIRQRITLRRTGHFTGPLKTFSVFNIRAQDRKKNARMSRLRTRIIKEHRASPVLGGTVVTPASPSDFPLFEARSGRIIKPRRLSRAPGGQFGRFYAFYDVFSSRPRQPKRLGEEKALRAKRRAFEGRATGRLTCGPGSRGRLFPAGCDWGPRPGWRGRGP